MVMIVIGRMHVCSGVDVEVFGQLHYILTDGSREGKKCSRSLEDHAEREEKREAENWTFLTCGELNMPSWNML